MSQLIKLPSSFVFPIYLRLAGVALYGLAGYLLYSEGFSWHIWLQSIALVIVGSFFATARHGVDINQESWKINNYWRVFGFKINNFQGIPALKHVILAKEYKVSSGSEEGLEGRNPQYGLYLFANSKERILVASGKLDKLTPHAKLLAKSLGKQLMVGDKSGFKPLGS